MNGFSESKNTIPLNRLPYDLLRSVLEKMKPKAFVRLMQTTHEFSSMEGRIALGCPHRIDMIEVNNMGSAIRPIECGRHTVPLLDYGFHIRTAEIEVAAPLTDDFTETLVQTMDKCKVKADLLELRGMYTNTENVLRFVKELDIKGIEIDATGAPNNLLAIPEIQEMKTVFVYSTQFFSEKQFQSVRAHELHLEESNVTADMIIERIEEWHEGKREIIHLALDISPDINGEVIARIAEFDGELIWTYQTHDKSFLKHRKINSLKLYPQEMIFRVCRRSDPTRINYLLMSGCWMGFDSFESFCFNIESNFDVDDVTPIAVDS